MNTSHLPFIFHCCNWDYQYGPRLRCFMLPASELPALWSMRHANPTGLCLKWYHGGRHTQKKAPIHAQHAENNPQDLCSLIHA
eukprot:1540308-Amphidinium_carterae.1